MEAVSEHVGGMHAAEEGALHELLPYGWRRRRTVRARRVGLQRPGPRVVKTQAPEIVTEPVLCSWCCLTSTETAG